MKSTLALAAASALLATAAIAQTTEFYVVQDTSTKKCSVVSTRPADTTKTTIVHEDGGSTTVYRSQSDAEAGLKKIKVCN